MKLVLEPAHHMEFLVLLLLDKAQLKVVQFGSHTVWTSEVWFITLIYGSFHLGEYTAI